ncbi:MAG: hypothetical protein KatS3mg110_1789 [Pirellulaceae bacterium]|nr:MAG: hypothetical protein KatS3mg110_1789 [Pirellulaceae bacterium]
MRRQRESRPRGNSPRPRLLGNLGHWGGLRSLHENDSNTLSSFCTVSRSGNGRRAFYAVLCHRYWRKMGECNNHWGYFRDNIDREAVDCTATLERTALKDGVISKA